MIPFQKIPIVEDVLDKIGVEQENIHLKRVGIQTGSGLNNNFGFLMIVLIFLALHPIILLLKKWIDFNNTKKWSLNFVLIKIVDLFTFIIYVRVFLEAYQILLITSLSELVRADFTGIVSVASFVSSLVILAFWLTLCFFSFYMFFSTQKSFDSDIYYKLGEFLAGIKNNKYCRLYSFISLIRRTLMVSWLIIFNYLESFILSYGLLGIQIIYFCIIIILRPFDRVENNLIEIINEIILMIMISFLVIFNMESEWTSLPTNSFLYIILANSMIITVVMIGEI